MRHRRRRRRSPRLADWQPQAQLRVPVNTVPAAATPAIDAHTHVGRWFSPDWAVPDVDELLELMSACNLAAIVNLDGRWGDELEANLDRYDRAHPTRFATFCQVDWSSTTAAGFSDRLVGDLRRSAASGAAGLKVWKDLGLSLRDPAGHLLLPNDPRLHDLWAAAGELGLPVLIHTADPLAFFTPVDNRNERVEELLAHPDWSHAARGVATYSRLLDALEGAVAAHPGTTWIGAHVGSSAEDLARVDRMLASYPNYRVDLAGRQAELGRQPRATRRLLTAHPDRVLFGSDTFGPAADAYAVWFRFLETKDEHFAYSMEPVPPQGRWAISGLGLPADVLTLIYRGNAERLLPSRLSLPAVPESQW